MRARAVHEGLVDSMTRVRALGIGVRVLGIKDLGPWGLALLADPISPTGSPGTGRGWGG